MILIIKGIQTDYSTFTYTNIGNIKNVLNYKFKNSLENSIKGIYLAILIR